MAAAVAVVNMVNQTFEPDGELGDMLAAAAVAVAAVGLYSLQYYYFDKVGSDVAHKTSLIHRMKAQVDVEAGSFDYSHGNIQSATVEHKDTIDRASPATVKTFEALEVKCYAQAEEVNRPAEANSHNI